MTEQPKTPVRVVVCAANRYGVTKRLAGPLLFLGARHFDERMREHMEHYDVEHLRRNYGEEQGFIDQWGVFMNREEALAVAVAAGQINVRRPKTNPEHLLFSEDLY